MADKCIVNKTTMSGIADAIRAKGGTTETMLPGQMAAKIAAIPSVGGDFSPFFDRTITGVLDLSTAGLQTVTQRQFESRTGLTEIIAPNLTLNNYACNGCSGLLKCTFRSTNNNATNLAGCTALSEVTFTGLTANLLVTYANLLGSVPTSCVFHCTNADVKYVSGAWVVVERN